MQAAVFLWLWRGRDAHEKHFCPFFMGRRPMAPGVLGYVIKSPKTKDLNQAITSAFRGNNCRVQNAQIGKYCSRQI